MKNSWIAKTIDDHKLLAAVIDCNGNMANASFSNQNHTSVHQQPKDRVLDNQVRVSTPENISFQYEITGPFRRLAAYIADVLIIVVAIFILMFAAFLFIWLLSFVFQFTGVGFGAIAGEMALGVIAIAWFLSLWFYGAYMEAYFNGRTLGKMLANIRTISVDGSAIDGAQATLRNFFRGLDVAPWVSTAMIFGPEYDSVPIIPIFGFGLICMTISSKFQRIGDLVAGTIVVTEEKKWTQGMAKFQDPRVAQLAELLPESFVVTPGLAKALAEYVDRRRVLPQQRVVEVASHLGNPLLQHFGLPKNTDTDLLLCSLYYKTFIHTAEHEINPTVAEILDEDTNQSMEAIG